MSRSLNVVNDVKTLEVEMLIREQGRSIKLLRTERREDARRRRQILIGAFCVDEDSLPSCSSCWIGMSGVNCRYGLPPGATVRR